MLLFVLGGHVAIGLKSIPCSSSSSTKSTSSRLHCSRFALKRRIFRVEKSGVGDVLRCEFADEGQEVFADEYPDDMVAVVLRLVHEVSRSQLLRNWSRPVCRGEIDNVSLLGAKSTAICLSRSRISCRSTSTVKDLLPFPLHEFVGWNSRAYRGL